MIKLSKLVSYSSVRVLDSAYNLVYHAWYDAYEACQPLSKDQPLLHRTKPVDPENIKLTSTSRKVLVKTWEDTYNRLNKFATKQMKVIMTKTLLCNSFQMLRLLIIGW